MTALVTTYGEGTIRPAPEAFGTWARKNRAYDGTAPGCVMMTPHNFGPVTYYGPGADEPRDLATRGYVVACPYPDSPVAGQTFGNDDAIASVQAAAAHLTGTLGCRTDGIYLLGMSMGALAVCNWARQHLDDVAAIALVTPALDLAVVHAAAPPYPAETEAAYGGLAALNAAMATHSPVEYAAELSAVPVAIWYSTNDTQTPLSDMEGFIDGHGNVTVTSLGAVGHNPSGATGTQIAEFYAAA